MRCMIGITKRPTLLGKENLLQNQFRHLGDRRKKWQVGAVLRGDSAAGQTVALKQQAAGSDGLPQERSGHSVSMIWRSLCGLRMSRRPSRLMIRRR